MKISNLLKSIYRKVDWIMNNPKRTLTLVITTSLLFGLTGCRERQDNIVTSAPKAAVETSNITEDENKAAAETNNIIEADNKINLNNLKFTLPSNWTKRGTESEIFFDDEKEQTVGGISVVGFYGDYRAALPNHSTILSSEDIDSSLGKGKLFTLEISNPAASKSPKTWNEIHAIIQSNNNNMAYDIWVNVKKDTLINILKSLH